MCPERSQAQDLMEVNMSAGPSLQVGAIGIFAAISPALSSHLCFLGMAVKAKTELFWRYKATHAVLPGPNLPILPGFQGTQRHQA